MLTDQKAFSFNSIGRAHVLGFVFVQVARSEQDR